MSLEYSLINTEYPALLHTSENVIFKDAIDKRTNFSIFFNKIFNQFVNKLLIKNLKDTINSIFLIGGSRSWDNFIENYNMDLSSLEIASIIPGNYDIFCICNNPEKVNDIINTMCKVFDLIIGFCHKNNIDVNYIRNYDQEDNTDLFTTKGSNSYSYSSQNLLIINKVC